MVGPGVLRQPRRPQRRHPRGRDAQRSHLAARGRAARDATRREVLEHAGIDPLGTSPRELAHRLAELDMDVPAGLPDDDPDRNWADLLRSLVDRHGERFVPNSGWSDV